jgi:hypothetical protein
MFGHSDPGWGYVKAGLVGAVVAAVILLSFPVLAAVGDNLILGRDNTANEPTVLSGSPAVNLRLTNTKKSAPALELQVRVGAPPLKVNSTGRVASLNADLLDGKHASAFLLASGTAANAQLLDGLDSTAFAPTGHDHAGVYLPLGGTAANSEMLDNLDSAAFAPFFHSHEAADITAGLLSSDRFSAYGDLGAEGVLNDDNPADLLTRSQADGRFVNEGDTAANADLLDGLNSTAFSFAGHNHAGVYLPISGVAADSSLLDGLDSTAFARRGSPCPPGEGVWGYQRTGPVCSGTEGSVALDTAGDVGQHPSLVLDPDGRPIVAYYDNDNHDLKVLRCGNPDCSGGNTLTTVDNAADISEPPSIALNLLGNPVLSYPDDSGTLKLVVCGNPGCTAGNGHSVLASGLPRAPSLAIGRDGAPLVAFLDQAVSDLKLAKCDNPTCTSSTVVTIDSAGEVGFHPSLAVSRSGLPVISYADGTNFQLKLVECGNAACTVGNTFAVLDTGAANLSSLVIGPDNNPVVAYTYDATSDLRLIRCGNPGCTSGNSIATVDAPGLTGFRPSLALDGSGFPVIAYSSPGTYSLMVARCGNSTCTAGNYITPVAPHGTSGGGTPGCLVLDASGHALMAYYESTAEDLRLAGAW